MAHCVILVFLFEDSILKLMHFNSLGYSLNKKVKSNSILIFSWNFKVYSFPFWLFENFIIRVNKTFSLVYSVVTIIKKWIWLIKNYGLIVNHSTTNCVIWLFVLKIDTRAFESTTLYRFYKRIHKYYSLNVYIIWYREQWALND